MQATEIRPRWWRRWQEGVAFGQLVTSRPFLLGLLAVGAGLRLWQYAGNASLVGDELAVAANLRRLPLPDLLLRPLEFHQVAPPGFLLAERLAVAWLGESEFTLRLLPLLSSVVSLVLFWRVAEQVLEGLSIPLAVGLFAIGPAFVFYGSVVKQYSSDVAIALILTLLALRLRGENLSRCQRLAAGVGGGALALLSHPSVLVLVGLGVPLIWLTVTGSERTRVRRLALPLLLWGAGAATASGLAITVLDAGTRLYMERFWQPGFAPFPPSGLADVFWLSARLQEVLGPKGLGYRWTSVFALVMLIGFWSLWRRSRDVAALLLGPILITLSTSVLRLYPFRTRLILFLVPAFLLALAEGMEWLRRSWPVRLRWLGALGSLALVVVAGRGLVVHPPVYRPEETKPVLAHVAARRARGDALYVYYGASHAARYYGSRDGLLGEEVVFGSCHRGDPRAYFRELDGLRGRPRVWVLIAHALPGLREHEAIVGYLDGIGHRRESVVLGGVSDGGVAPSTTVAAYLYDLSDERRLGSAQADTFQVPRPERAVEGGLGCPSGPPRQPETDRRGNDRDG